MRRGWNLFDLFFGRTKRPKLEDSFDPDVLFSRTKRPKLEDSFDPDLLLSRTIGKKKEKHILSYEQPDGVGELINSLFDSPLEDFYITKDRGYTRISCYKTYTFPEIKKYYRGERHIDFLCGIEEAFGEEDGKFPVEISGHRDKYIENVFRNELMYQLMKYHGSTYEAAFNFTENLIVPDGEDMPIDEKQTNENIKSKIGKHPLYTIFCEMIADLNSLAYVCLDDHGYKF